IKPKLACNHLLPDAKSNIYQPAQSRRAVVRHLSEYCRAAETASRGLSLKKPSIPVARNARISAFISPASDAEPPFWKSLDKKAFSARNVQGCTARPALCAAATRPVGSPR